MREIEFAESAIVPILFEYKMQDFNEGQKEASEITKEFKSGQLDPKMAFNVERTTKEMLKKGVLLK